MPKRRTWSKARRDKYAATMAAKHQGVTVTDIYSERAAAAKPNGAHPNADLIGKVLDALVNPQTNEEVAQRLLVVLDRLMP